METSTDGTVVSGDPQLGDLAAQFLAARQRLPHRSSLFTLSLPRLSELVRSERPEDLRDLIPALRDLRTLVEQHSYEDVAGILGEM
jgi:hypothetical protein